MNKPGSANEVLTSLKEDHQWAPDPIDLGSTGGIQRAIEAQWHAIQALADYIDGKATGKTNSDGSPVKATDPNVDPKVDPRANPKVNTVGR